MRSYEWVTIWAFLVGGLMGLAFLASLAWLPLSTPLWGLGMCGAWLSLLIARLAGEYFRQGERSNARIERAMLGPETTQYTLKAFETATRAAKEDAWVL